MKKSLFIAFEGLDGSGKSTQVKLLADRLQKEGHKIYTTAEPTTRPIGKMLRDIFNHRMEADHRTIAALFVADRLDHLLNKTDGILKKLEDGYTVISDRYCFSSYAYQGVHTDMQWVIEANALSTQLLRPDLHIYVDVTPEEGMKRLNKGRTSMEIYETLENQVSVRKKYFEAFEMLRHSERIAIIDGNRLPEVIANEIWNLIINYQLSTINY